MPGGRRRGHGLLGRAGGARLGAGRRLRDLARAPLGAGSRLRARLGDPRAPLPARPARARRRARGLARPRRTTTGSRRSSTSRAHSPSRARPATTSAWPRRSSRSAASPTAGRSFSRPRTAGSTCSQSGWRAASRTRSWSRGRPRASGCSSASGTRSTRSSSPRRPSGRAWTFRGSRSRCSSSTSCRSRRRATRSSRRAASGSRGAAGTGSRSTRVPSAMLQLRQGFGRLIRGHADQGVVAILDPRLRTRGVRAPFPGGAAAGAARGRARRRRRVPGRRGARNCLIPLVAAWPRRIESRHRPSDPSRRPRPTSTRGAHAGLSSSSSAWPW